MKLRLFVMLSFLVISGRYSPTEVVRWAQNWQYYNEYSNSGYRNSNRTTRACGSERRYRK